MLRNRGWKSSCSCIIRPVYTGTSAPEIVATLKDYGIRRCFYGHLHGNAIRYAVQGDVDGIRYKLVSADGLRFCPYRIN